jgi:predicted transcriptional regulator
MSKPETLTRRERQAMDAVCALGEATAKEVQQRMPNPPSYSAVRAVLSRLVEQGHLKYRESGPRYVYTAAAGRKRVGQAALRKLVDTFFDGSPLRTMNALLGLSAAELSKEELDELAKTIEQARERNK